MPYVTRDPEGRIIALHADPNGGAKEELAADHPDLLSFVGTHVRLSEIRNELEDLDLELVRVVEDLVAVLVDNGILELTDLPTAARNKLARRIKLRTRLDALRASAEEPAEEPAEGPAKGPAEALLP